MPRIKWPVIEVMQRVADGAWLVMKEEKDGRVFYGIATTTPGGKVEINSVSLWYVSKDSALSSLLPL